jgi:hypothetical protein
MDETSIAKGHDYITLFVDLEERKTLHISAGKDHKTFSPNQSFLLDTKQIFFSNLSKPTIDLKPDIVIL